MEVRIQKQGVRRSFTKNWSFGRLLVALQLFVAASIILAAEPEKPKKLLDDLKAVAEAQKAAQQAATTFQQMRNKSYQAAGVTAGLPKVQNDFNTAKATIERVTKEVTKEVKERPGYLRAVKEADAAREKLSKLAGDKSLSEEARRKEADALTQVIWGPAEMIRTTLEGNSTLRSARETMENSQIEITNLQRDVTGILQQDTALAELARKSQEAADKLVQAKRELAISQKAYDDARKKR